MPQIRSQNEFVVNLYVADFGTLGNSYAAVPKRGRLKRILVGIVTTTTGTTVVTIEKEGTSIGRTFDLEAATAPEVLSFDMQPFTGSGGVILEFDKGDTLILNSGGQGAGGEAYVALVMEELAESRP